MTAAEFERPGVKARPSLEFITENGDIISRKEASVSAE
jgi:hypothetical protein